MTPSPLYRFLFLVVLLSLLYLSQRFWFRRAWRRLQKIRRPGWKRASKVLWFAAVLLVLASFLDPMLGHFIPRRGLGMGLIAVGRLWLGGSLFAALFIAGAALLEFLSRPVTQLAPATRSFDPARRSFFRYLARVTSAIPFVVAVYGFTRVRLRYHVERVEIAIPGWPKSLDGLRIVQLSDIHIGDFMPRMEVRHAVDIANQLGADLAVVTGDLVNDSIDGLEDCIAELSRLRAPLGTWGCNGNHEIYADAEDDAQELFAQYGMRLLRQRNVEVEYRGGRFNLIGVDYQRTRTMSGERIPMLRGVEPMVRRDIPNILLSHNPNSFPRAAELGIELSLAGHTHGGQVRLEILDRRWSPARFITDFPAGLYQLPMGDSAAPKLNGSASTNSGGKRLASLYVNRGLGTIAVPVRWGVPPEITLLTLRSAG